MTKIKMCGLRREADIEYANRIMPEFVGFVFAKQSKRYVTVEKAFELRYFLDYRIASVGVFVDEAPEAIAEIAERDIINAVQLHGNEDSAYIKRLRELCDVPIIKAYKINSVYDIECACLSDADFVLLDSGNGSGKTFDHSLIRNIDRPYFLAGGVTPQNARSLVNTFSPYAIDASSSLETDGFKDFDKMKALADAVRNERID